MAKLNLVLAALFCFLALSSAAEPQLNDASTSDLPVDTVPTFNPLIELPRANQEDAVVSELPASIESTEELTTVTFRHEDRNLDGPRGKRLRHGHRHFKPEEMSFGNDMILSSHHDEGSDDVEEKPERWVKIHHHEEHEFGDSNGSDMMEIASENDDVRRPDHHRHNHRRFEREGDNEREDHHDHHHNHGRFDRDDDEEREGRGQRVDREDDEERGGLHHHRRHHHDHHRHHRNGEKHDEEGGVVMKMRKFLMGRF